jgi:hypothetical protein
MRVKEPNKKAKGITYIPADPGPVEYVYSDGKRVGAIYAYKGKFGTRYFYKPTGAIGGDEFDNIADVKRSLEGS